MLQTAGIQLVVLDLDAFTLSKPELSFSRWYKQTTGIYRAVSKAVTVLIALYSLSQFDFYPLFVAAMIGRLGLVLGIFGLRLIIQSVIYSYKGMRKW
jgi:hypothetical protein